jgi:hypothetical protein
VFFRLVLVWQVRGNYMQSGRSFCALESAAWKVFFRKGLDKVFAMMEDA